MNKRSGFAHALVLILLLLVLVAAVYLVSQATHFFNKAAGGDSGIRGTAGDLWADVEVGKRDFTEIGYGKVVPNKVSIANGVIVDRSTSPGKLYVWDAGNNRILGVDLAKCYGQSGACTADVIIGQPFGTDYGACNLDSSMQNAPHRSSASANTICGQNDHTFTTLEDASNVNMFVDSQGNLYVPDARNNRVLEYNNPFASDNIADNVWGQNGMTGVYCNQTEALNSNGTIDQSGGTKPPTASSLCYQNAGGGYGMGVTLDSAGNMWVADAGNQRLLRFPAVSGAISKVADLVLGQQNFTTGPWAFGTGVNQFHEPRAVRVAADGKVYVADNANNRVMVFSPPLSNGMAGSVFVSGLSGPQGLEIDPNNQGLWILDNDGWNNRLRLYDFNGNLLKTVPGTGNRANGSIGFDASGNIILALGSDVVKYSQQNGNYQIERYLFSPPQGANSVTAGRFTTPGWGGIAVTSNQLVVATERLLFWNNPDSLTNGKDADGYVGVSSGSEIPGTTFGQIKKDSANRIWVTRINNSDNFGRIEVYQGPLTTGASPIKTINFPLQVLGGGQINFSGAGFQGLTPTPDGKYLWVSETRRNRVMRIRDPLTNPVVDIILGQKDATGVSCNRGETGANESGTQDLSMLCSPSALSFDQKGNLYVSDHYIEAEGNWRILMFAPSLFPDSLTAPLFNLSATKEFPRSDSTSNREHMAFETAFDSINHMVVGNNPYSGKRFVDYYNNPDQVNPSNPRDPEYAKPSGQLKDFYGWPVAATFDNSDNLYVYDANRGQVRIYKTPFISSPTTHKQCVNNACSSVIGVGTDQCQTNSDCNPTINHSPVAGFTFTQTKGSFMVKFANTSTDQDKDTLKYSWNFGDGATSTAASPSHTYRTLRSKKSYTVTLKATDSHNASSSVSKLVTVPK